MISALPSEKPPRLLFSGVGQRHINSATIRHTRLIASVVIGCVLILAPIGWAIYPHAVAYRMEKDLAAAARANQPTTAPICDSEPMRKAKRICK